MQNCSRKHLKIHKIVGKLYPFFGVCQRGCLPKFAKVCLTPPPPPPAKNGYPIFANLCRTCYSHP